MLPDDDITRPASSLTLLKLQVVVHDNPAHNRLDRTRCEEPTRTRLTPKSKVHICWADTDKTS